MKKLALALAVATLSLSTAAFAADETAAEPTKGGTTGNIKFEGRIIESGCTLETGNSATINLGTMSVAAIQKNPSSWNMGQIKFLDCNLPVKDKDDEEVPIKPENQIVGVELTINPGLAANFERNEIETDLGVTVSDLWRNLGQAQNVGIQVAISARGATTGEPAAEAVGTSGEPVTPAIGTKAPIRADVLPGSNMAIYDVVGRMIGAASGVTVGSVETTITFNAVYK